jgi:hypothetical protein
MILDMLRIKLFLQALVHVLQTNPQRRILDTQHLLCLFPTKHVRLGVDLLSGARGTTRDSVERFTGKGVDDVDDVLAVERAVGGDEALVGGGGGDEGFVVREGDVSDL